MNIKKVWTNAENEMLAKVVLTDRSVGLTFEEAYKDASRTLKGRTKYACERQWRKIKHNYKEQLSSFKSTKKNAFKSFTIDSFQNRGLKEPNKNNQTKQTLVNSNSIKNQQTQLQMLLNSVKVAEKEKLTVVNSGKGGSEFIVLNNEGDFGYLVSTVNGKVTSCNCPHNTFRGASCKHMLKVALDKNLEIF